VRTTDPHIHSISNLHRGEGAEKIVGVIGMEAYGRVGCSLVVRGPGLSGRGVAKMLNARMMPYAQMHGIDRLYMSHSTPRSLPLVGVPQDRQKPASQKHPVHVAIPKVKVLPGRLHDEKNGI